MSKPLYKETQSLWWFVLIFIFIACFVLLAGIFQWGSKPVPGLVAICISVLFLGLTLLFYNLSITITDSYAEAKFGIGVFKRRVFLEDLDIEKAEIVQLKLYQGIGYRYSNRGLFLNTKPGPALFIPGKSGGRSFFVGTKNGDKILNILLQ